MLTCTSIHNAEFGNTRKNDRNTGQAIQKPVAILDYDKYMGAVDRCDQMISYPTFKRRTLKWWKKVFFYLLMLATLNVYLLYSASSVARRTENQSYIKYLDVKWPRI